MRVSTLFFLLTLTIVLRVVSILTSLYVAESRTGSHISLHQYAALHDGREYQQIAKAIFSEEKLRALPSPTQRLFPGYPFTIRIFSSLMSPSWAALVIAILSSAIAVILFWRITGDSRLAAWFAVFPPSWMLFSSTAMSEGLFLALALAGFLLWIRGNRGLAALTLGFSVLVRPVGLFVFAACWIAFLLERPRGRKFKTLSITLAFFLIFPVIWMGAAWVVWGDPLRQFHAYVSKDYTLPFVSLLQGTLSPGISLFKKGLVWFTLATNLLALGLLTKRWWETRAQVDLAWLLWLALMSLFHLGLPSEWTFGSLDRFFLTAAPPMFVGLSPWMPRKSGIIAGAAMISIIVCLYWNSNMLIVVMGR